MAGAFSSTQKSFLQTNAWQHQNLNALRYNTSQAGSVIPWIDGTIRQQVNLIDFGDYMGPGGGGKKGKGVGPLPIGGTNSSGGFKGGGGGKGKGKGGGKKGGNQHFSVDVAFGLCQGPVTIAPQSFVWSSAGVAFFQSAGLNWYGGADGQAADPVMAGLHAGSPAINYSGTAVVTGTPMDLGMSPVIPNLSFEPAGPNAGTAGPSFPHDANPSKVVSRFLADPRDGAQFPAANIAPDIDTIYGDYCLAAGLVISPALTGQQRAAEWLSALAKLTNTAIVWSGALLKFIPYGDQTLSANGASWVPNLVPEYSLTDDDFIEWHPSQLGQAEVNQDDPILLTRSNPADAVNWLTIEYLDRSNFYNTTILPVFDQGAIDQYTLRTGANLNGHCFCNAASAQVAAQLHLQRLQYIRNTYKFQLGWQFALLEPMDIVLLSGRCGDLYLDLQPVRITAIDENENGDLTIEAEEIAVALPTCAPPTPAALPSGPITAPSFDLSSRFAPPAPVNTVTNAGNIGLQVGGSKIVLALIVNRGTPASTQSVVGVTDNLGLSWNRRWAFNAIGSDDVGIAMELWWADSSAVVGNSTITVTAMFSDIAAGPGIFVTPVVGSVNPAAPFDTNPSFPAKQSGNLIAPAVSGLTTNSSNAMLIAFLVNDGSWGATLSDFSPPPDPRWNVYIAGLAPTFPLGVSFTASRISEPLGVSGYTAQPFFSFPTNSPNINPTSGPYWLVVDAIAGT